MILSTHILALLLGIFLGFCLGGIVFYTWEINQLRALYKENEEHGKQIERMMKIIKKEDECKR